MQRAERHREEGRPHDDAVAEVVADDAVSDLGVAG